MAKRFLLYILSVCCLICCMFALIACGNTDIVDTDDTHKEQDNTQQEQEGNGDNQKEQEGNGSQQGQGGWTLERAYAAACDLGYEGTIEQFFEIIGGEDGVSVIDVYIDENEHLIVLLSDESTIDCGKTTHLEACEHSYTAWHVELAPTCTSIGYSMRECKLCGDKQYYRIEATGHYFGSKQTLVAPSCEEAGSGYIRCATCGVTEITEIPPTGHKQSEKWIIENDYHKGTCERCGRVLLEEEHIPANGACAECGIPCDSVGLDYTIVGKTVTITGIGKCTDTNIVIPEYINGYQVVAIGDRAFVSNRNIERVSIPASVNYFGIYAFNGCTNLNAINISDLAAWCNATITEHNSVIYYGSSPLLYAQNLYLNGELVTELIIPDGVTAIKAGTFYGCTSIESVYIPSGVSKIDDGAFLRCPNVGEITVSLENNSYYSEGNCLIENKSQTLIWGCKNSVIPTTGVTKIGAKAFNECTGLTYIEIPENITSINSGAFLQCTNLKEVILPNGITAIGGSTFSHCGLTGITIPESVTYIDANAFDMCSELKEVFISKSVTYLGVRAFGECYRLEKVYYEGSQEEWTELISKDGYSQSSFISQATLYIYTEEYPFNEEITEGAFWRYVDGKITEWELPSHVHNFNGSNLCEGCGYYSLEYQLADGYYIVTGLGKSAAALKTDIHLYIPEEYKGVPVKEIAEHAFRDARVRSVTIPKSIVKIGNAAFGSSLGYLYIDDLAAYCQIEMVNWVPTHYAHSVYYNGKLLTELVIPDGVEHIGNGIFNSYSKLTKVVISASVKSIGASAFSKCENLNEVTFAAGSKLEIINKSSFYQCKALTNINLPQTVTEIGERAFTASGFITFVFPESVTKVGNAVLEACDSLTAVKLPSDLTEIPESMFYSCTSLAEIEIPNSVTNIGNMAFAYCTSLKSVVIPQSVQGNLINTFYRCTALESAVIAGKVIRLLNTFYGCTALKSVVISNSVIHMTATFTDCQSLERVYYTGSEQQWEQITFYASGEFYENTTLYFYSEEYPFVGGVEEGNFWHYAEDEIVVWNKED